jgi:hypothetical protein
MSANRRFRVWFNDECPAVGSGVRFVEVRTIGRKWVYLRECRRMPSFFSRIKRSVWNEVVLEEKE